MRILLTFFVALSILSSGFGQGYVTKKTASSKLLKIVDKGTSYSVSNQPAKAIKEFEKALGMEPKFIDVYLYVADEYRATNQHEKAEASLYKAVEIDPDYQPKVFYVLGMMQFDKDKFEEAQQSFERYLTYPIRSPEFKVKVERHAANAKFAATAIKNPVPFDPKNMGAAVNTGNMEYWPSISVDGETFTFTREIGGNEDFYVSTKKEGVWQTAVNMGPPVNTPRNEGAQSISADGRTMVFTVCNREGDYGKCDIYISRKKDKLWTSPENIGAPISSPAWESQPTLSADGKTILFCRGKDNRDKDKNIYGSYLKDDGTWIKPIKMGPSINTKFSEEAPFLHPDGQTLYFVSDGHPGMGKSDIFLSRKQSDGSWGQAENLGYPINTKESEFSMIVNFDGSTGYFSSGIAGGNGKLDIYEFELPATARPSLVTYVKATVFDGVTKERLVADIELVNLSTGKVHTKSLTNENGEFLVCLPMGNDYSLNVAKTEYLFHSENFGLKGVNSFEEPFLLEIGLQKIPPKIIASTQPGKPIPATVTVEKAKPIILKNVFFETASAELLDVSIAELNKLRDLLNEHPSMRIQLNGHTDNVGSDSDNMTLSVNRAKAVQDYLKKEGIMANRLTYKGFGENLPIATNETLEGRASNRRTEFVIIN